MKIKNYRLVTILFTMMGLDTGAHVKKDAVIPEEWERWFETAEKECDKLSPQEAEDLTQGSEEDQVRVREKAPYAYRLLDAAFDDGPLSELVFSPWGDIYAARAAERAAPPWPEYRRHGVDVNDPNPDGSDYHVMNAVDDAASQSEHAASHRDGEEKEKKT